MRNLFAARAGLCCAIVVALHAHAAARSTTSEDVPVPGGSAAFARTLDIDPAPDRARFIGELTRLQLDPQKLKTLLAVPPSRQTGADLVPVPLTAALWSQAILRRPATAANLVGAILNDRQASLLCHGLTALDDETLDFFAHHPSLLTRLYENAAPTFAAFAAGLHVHGGRIVTPGGSAAATLWEAVVDARVAQPERFVRELFERGDGRVAYLYDIIAQLDQPQAAFALGLWIDNPATRADRFHKLVAATITAQREWRVKTFPFARPLYDIASILTRVRADGNGRPIQANRQLWSSVFEGGRAAGDSLALSQSHDAATIDAAWLAETIAARDVREREDRADQFAFGQRVFADSTDTALPAVLTAVRAFPHLRMLMLTLERIGITNAVVYAEAARRVVRLGALDPNRGFEVHAQLQGALALVTRMARVHTIDTARAEALASSLIAVPLNDDGRYAGAMTRWMRETLGPALAPADSIEDAILAALAGRRADASPDRTLPVRVAWEGQQYRLDLTAAESRRLRRIREKQGGLPVDVAVAIDAAAQTLGRERVTAEDVRTAIATLKKIAGDFEPPVRDGRAMPPPGVDPPKNARDILDRALKDLAKIDVSRDAARAARAVQPAVQAIEEVADTVLADALLSLVYAVDLGDPDGTVLLAGNVARRHDFGFGVRDGEMRQRIAWGLPKQDLAPGMPWHVSGSLLGLDVALAPLALRRISADPVAAAPKLTSNERESFAVSVALMDPLALRNADLETIALAVERGRRRVAAMATHADTFDAVAAEITLDGWRRRAVQWSLAHDPALVPSMFSMTELLRLGGGPPAASLDAWGMSAHASDGCLCTRFTAPGHWTLWIGRPQLGLVATGVADLNLIVAVTLHDLRLPAALARHVLSAAVQDFIDQVRPTDAYDWLTLVRAAQQVSRERVEDYVASAAADGPLVREPSGGSTR